MKLADSIRHALARLRRRTAEHLERDVTSADDARRRGSEPVDPSAGRPLPPHDYGSWTGLP